MRATLRVDSNRPHYTAAEHASQLSNDAYAAFVNCRVQAAISMLRAGLEELHRSVSWQDLRPFASESCVEHPRRCPTRPDLTSLDRLRAALTECYHIERELGVGGTATVYLAHDLKHDRDVALKVLRPELTAEPGTQRFLHEIRITASLDHPHILALIDSDESDGLLWYTQPYVRGESLRVRMRREKQMALEDVLAITRQVASALDYAHRRGVIHRDIKPENILLFEGEAMLADFGIALALGQAAGTRLTECGVSLGTPQYMSPEQANGEGQLDARSDLYSLAAVVYEMVAGEPPHNGQTIYAVLASLLREQPLPLHVLRPTVPATLERAIGIALAKAPADRYASAGEFVAALTGSML